MCVCARVCVWGGGGGRLGVRLGVCAFVCVCVCVHACVWGGSVCRFSGGVSHTNFVSHIPN